MRSWDEGFGRFVGRTNGLAGDSSRSQTLANAFELTTNLRFASKGLEMTDHCLANFDCRLGSFSTMEEAPSRWNSRFFKTHCHKSCEGNFSDGWGASGNEKEQPWPRAMIGSTSCQGVHRPCQQRRCRLCCGELQIAVWTVSPMQCTSLNCLRPRVPHVPWLGCGWGWPFFLLILWAGGKQFSS